MNVTLKNIPDEVYRELKRTAEEQGRSLNSQIIRLLASEASEQERRRKMRASRRRLERFVASLPRVDESTALIREDRKR